MFTGIVEEIGTLRRLRVDEGGADVEIAASTVLDGTRIGDSILTDGVCLTVTALRRDGFVADAMPETVRRTTLSAMAPGTPLNLERALRADGRFGGHLVTGHVDGVGVLRRSTAEGIAVVLEIECPGDVAEITVPRGSLAVSGVSLTVVSITGQVAVVSLIPHTAAATTISRLKPGAKVNLEADVIGRYVLAYLARTQVGGRAVGGLTAEKLAEAGFL